MVSLYAVTKVLIKIWGDPFSRPPPGRGVQAALSLALCSILFVIFI